MPVKPDTSASHRPWLKRVLKAAASALLIVLLIVLLAAVLITLELKIGIAHIVTTALVWLFVIAIGSPLLMLFFPALGFPLLWLMLLPEWIMTAIRRRKRRNKSE
ncbi:MAG: hypothetical protein CMI03_19790 [Oceanospirillaceae bacterium]|uniref:hypothetical protein n=1 Tax=unclassified Thalassolituus TaxID=2624967 RepID=UPI000C5D509C|nr:MULTISPECIES: hypothetical protein [unclassified Thalassolituus]MBS54986.1 hypothetical protein [Oceanospirillaceae bacterium]|tara:strand:- start:1589 stop:1903 length:315 start_codon:yes stop_codon:yes gene_type:complete